MNKKKSSERGLNLIRIIVAAIIVGVVVGVVFGLLAKYIDPADPVRSSLILLLMVAIFIGMHLYMKRYNMNDRIISGSVVAGLVVGLVNYITDPEMGIFLLLSVTIRFMVLVYAVVALVEVATGEMKKKNE